ncbi:arsenate reductase ArsC [Rubricoccus marinus]|nr:arsenate reductase ArsC [Rubricoccus marinus]
MPAANPGASPVASGAMSALEGSDHHDVFSDARPLVLFVCTHNSARSQLAEGLLRQKYGARYRAESAGTVARGVHPLAAEALQAVGIDASAHTSKTIESLGDLTPDVVVTVCDNAREACPYIPAERNLHHAFRDPSAVEGTDDDRRRAFAEVREEIADWLDATFG